MSTPRTKSINIKNEPKDVKDPYASIPEDKVLTVKLTEKEKAVAESLSGRFSSNTLKGANSLMEAMASSAPDVVDTSNKLPVKEVKDLTEEEESEFSLDKGHNLFRDRMYYTNTPYDNADVRKRIEKGLTPLSFEELLFDGRVTQKVSILPGKLEPVYQSLRSADTSRIEKHLVTSFENEFEARTWLSMAKLAACVLTINGNTKLISTFDDKGDLDLELLKKKVENLSYLSESVVNVLMVNLRWFENRVHKLFDGDFEQLKNG